MKALITKVFRFFSENDRLCASSPNYHIISSSFVITLWSSPPAPSITSSRPEYLGALLQLVQEVCLLLCGGQCSVHLGAEYEC